MNKQVQVIISCNRSYSSKSPEYHTAIYDLDFNILFFLHLTINDSLTHTSLALNVGTMTTTVVLSVKQLTLINDH